MLKHVLVSLGLFALAAPAWADRFSLTYEASSFRVLDLGHAQLDADVTDTDYRISANLESKGILDLFERTRLTADAAGDINNGAVVWRAYDLDHYYSKKHRVITLRVGEDGALERDITPNYRIWGDPPANLDQMARSRDPLSSLIAMAVDIGQFHRCAGAYPTFDGRYYYLLELAGGEIDRFRGGGYEGQVLKCSMSYIPVAGFEATDNGRRRIPHGQVWFALEEDSRFAPPVRIETPLAAGAATIRLTSWRRAAISVQGYGDPEQ